MINLLDNTPNQPSTFRKTNWAEINNESQEMYDATSDIKFKTSMIRPSLCDYRDAYIHVKGIITIPNTASSDVNPDNRNKKVIFKNCAPLIFA